MKNATTVLDPSELENYNQLFWDLASRKLQKKILDHSERASVKNTQNCSRPERASELENYTQVSWTLVSERA